MMAKTYQTLSMKPSDQVEFLLQRLSHLLRYHRLTVWNFLTAKPISDKNISKSHQKVTARSVWQGTVGSSRPSGAFIKKKSSAKHAGTTQRWTIDVKFQDCLMSRQGDTTKNYVVMSFVRQFLYRSGKRQERLSAKFCEREYSSSW